MERQYVDNPSLKERRTPQDLLKTFNKSEQIAVTSMSKVAGDSITSFNSGIISERF